jgi:transcriptional antiterminator NusG
MGEPLENRENPDVEETEDITETEQVEVADFVETEAPEADTDPQETEAPEAEMDIEAPQVEDEPIDTEDEAIDPEVMAQEEAASPTVEETSAPVETADAEAGTEEAIEPPPVSPYDKPGDWYVIHSYSGYENKVKANLETRIQSMHMEDRIFEVHIPMEDVVEFKGGKKVTVPKKVFPGYILVRMSLDDDSWYAVRNTPGVTGFVAGNAQKPTPLSRREVERFLGVQEEEDKGKPRFKPEWDVGEQVRVVTGPFADFNGVIEELNVDQQKVVVLVNIFGRDTPVELGFEDIQKN